VSTTLLAVDDSVTMRKVLEITFAGPDFRVVTAPTADAAVQKFKADKPDLVIADLTLDAQKSGYDLCKALKQLSPSTPVVLLSSKQNPFDPAKGTAAQADDHMDKPFDTQQLIDKVKKLLPAKAWAGAGVRPDAVAPPPAAAAAPLARAPATSPSTGAPSQPATRAKTLIYNPATGTPGLPSAPAAAAAKPAQGVTAPTPLAPTPVTGLPLQQKVASAPAPAPAPRAEHHPAAAAAAPVAAAHVNGQMAGKLEQIGLTPAQVEAVLALSKEIVERVVWEVVPVMAETIIKEEIARLTK
jgi:DNA-binding response OmpR family regulator